MMMEKQDRDLVMQALSYGLPYGIKVKFDCEPYISVVDSVINVTRKDRGYYDQGVTVAEINSIDNYLPVTDIKPVLRSMSSMTKEEEEEYNNIDNRSYSCPKDYAHIPAKDRIDWLNSHHFDYLGLLVKGLAVDGVY